MFKNLTKFKVKRNLKEAIGFYIAYLVFVVLVSVVAATLAGMVTGNDNFEFGVRIGTMVAILTSLALSFAILKERNLQNNFVYVLLALVAGVLAYFGGGLLGLIPVAYLSTRKK